VHRRKYQRTTTTLSSCTCFLLPPPRFTPPASQEDGNENIQLKQAALQCGLVAYIAHVQRQRQQQQQQQARAAAVAAAVAAAGAGVPNIPRHVHSPGAAELFAQALQVSERQAQGWGVATSPHVSAQGGRGMGSGLALVLSHTCRQFCCVSWLLTANPVPCSTM
jgi:hypothetical protein